MIRIDDAEDARIAHYRAVRDRDLAGRGGRFVAEGEVVIMALLSGRSRFRPESLLLSETRAEALAPVLSQLPRDLPVFVAGQRVMDAIVGFHIHRGALAIGRRGETADPTSLLSGLPQPALVLGLVGLSNHDNVGGAFRNAAAFGADAVLLDRSSCDPLYRKAVRVSVGASLLVPFAWTETADDMVRALEDSGFAVVALSPQGSELLDRETWPERTALLVGAEGPGLPPALIDRLRSVRISMAPGFDSLNVATAAGIALHAVWTSRRRHCAD
ncbi:TrmH family RNA methyltransferase [Enterovirga aerilata]|uniref:RNA methyltransferase n=1 Tax=Enterovirga aerilata TaxID=2730920 RepID=A0A849IDH7_9HYPH|nr:RNA methyltransferase [Enterovirga sp. DB1703]NNM74489.1 RNA methyltransferase [Enterovirga sp. DB1703]